MNLTKNAIKWINTGEHGLSSMTIFHKMTGLWLGGKGWGPGSYPLDVDDFFRCVKLFNMVPEFRLRLQEMDQVSVYWRLFAAEWSKIEEHFWVELQREDGKFPETSAIIDAIFKQGRKCVGLEAGK